MAYFVSNVVSTIWNFTRRPETGLKEICRVTTQALQLFPSKQLQKGEPSSQIVPLPHPIVKLNSSSPSFGGWSGSCSSPADPSSSSDSLSLMSYLFFFLFLCLYGYLSLASLEKSSRAVAMLVHNFGTFPYVIKKKSMLASAHAYVHHNYAYYTAIIGCIYIVHRNACYCVVGRSPTSYCVQRECPGWLAKKLWKLLRFVTDLMNHRLKLINSSGIGGHLIIMREIGPGCSYVAKFVIMSSSIPHTALDSFIADRCACVNN